MRLIEQSPISAELADLKRRASQRRELCFRVKRMIIERLDLPISPAWITDDQPLIGRGLELDSVDTLELIIAVDAEFGVVISDDEIGVFGSVSHLVDRIEISGDGAGYAG
jgi:acyl carrier protein